MKLYSCKINLKGSLLNQVIKSEVTAAEIVLLRAIHGNDAVNDIRHTANVNRTDRAERARLAGRYTMTSPKGTKRGDELVREFLGIESQPLPQEPPAVEVAAAVDGFTVETEEDEVIVPVDAEPIKRTRVSRAAELTG